MQREPSATHAIVELAVFPSAASPPVDVEGLPSFSWAFVPQYFARAAGIPTHLYYYVGGAPMYQYAANVYTHSAEGG